MYIIQNQGVGTIKYELSLFDFTQLYTWQTSQLLMLAYMYSYLIRT